MAQAGYLLDAEQPLVAAQYSNPEAKEDGGVYDAHYLIGNYYQFNAVTAGSGAGITTFNTVAGNSICPKGWMLPAAGKNDDNQPIVNPNQNKASFYQLLSAYGYPKTGGWSLNGTIAQMAIKHRNENVEDNVAAGPMFFVRSGLIDVGAGYLRVPGGNAYLWSSTIMSDSHAFFYAFYNYDVMPTIAYNKNYVFPARCVAR